MCVFKRELRAGFKAFCIWGGGITFMIVICIIMFPEMKNQMTAVTDMFANMGGFTAAFGMDKVSFGEIMGFYGVECGNILGIGAALYAAYIGVSVLSKEEKEHTAEFLYTHPVSRSHVLLMKLLAVFAQLVVMNVLITAISALSIAAIGEQPAVKEFLLMHFAYLLLQLEIAGICFGVSAFVRGGSIGIGIGLASMFYFLGLIRNISESADFLKYLTPFAYAEATDIIADGKLEVSLILLGAVVTFSLIAAAFLKYRSKDIF